nr:uncharacterized protein LOC105864823 [Microcebus murinus]
MAEFGLFFVDDFGVAGRISEKIQDLLRSSVNWAPGTGMALLSPPTLSFSFGRTGFTGHCYALEPSRFDIKVIKIL